jgi:hypothetical protein
MRPSQRTLGTVAAAVVLFAAPAAAAGATALAVKFTSVPVSVQRGAPARIEVATVAGAICDIEVRSPAGLVRTAGIRPKKALQGRITWTWRVGKTMRPGTWKVVVDCLLGEHVGRVETRFVVK